MSRIVEPGGNRGLRSSSGEPGLFDRIMMPIAMVAGLAIMGFFTFVVAMLAWMMVSGTAGALGPTVLDGLALAASSLAQIVSADGWLAQLAPAQIAINVAFGFVAGLAIGLLRLWRSSKRRRWLTEQTAESLGDPVAISAAGVSTATLGLHVAVCTLLALAIAALGVSLPQEWLGAGAAEPSPLLLALSSAGAVAIGGGDGGAGAGPGFLAGLLALVLVLIAVGLATGLLTHAVAGLVAARTISVSVALAAGTAGAQTAAGRVIGANLVLAMTRAGTGEPLARQPLSWDFAYQWREHQRQWRARSHELGAFEHWAAANGTPLGYQSYSAAAAAYRSHLKRLRVGHAYVDAMFAIDSFGNRLPALQAQSEKPPPKGLLAVPGGAALVRGEAGALLYPGWFGRSLLTGARTGFISSMLYAVVVLALVRWLA